MFASKTLTSFTSLFSPYDFEKSDNIILKYFKDEWNNFIETFNKISLTDQTKLD